MVGVLGDAEVAGRSSPALTWHRIRRASEERAREPGIAAALLGAVDSPTSFDS
jgi:hypothetical protein